MNELDKGLGLMFWIGGAMGVFLIIGILALATLGIKSLL